RSNFDRCWHCPYGKSTHSWTAASAVLIVPRTGDGVGEKGRDEQVGEHAGASKGSSSYIFILPAHPREFYERATFGSGVARKSPKRLRRRPGRPRSSPSSRGYPRYPESSPSRRRF